MIGRLVFCALVGAGVGFAVHTLRGFFPSHAFLIGLASAALAYSVFRAVDNLRRAAGQAAPGHQQHAGDDQQMHQAAEDPTGEQ